MILNCLILKPLFRPSWLQDAQVEVEHHKLTKKRFQKKVSVWAS